MKANELRAKDEAALKKELEDLQNTLFKLRVQKATQQLQHTNPLRTTRHEIAPVRTDLAQKAAQKLPTRTKRRSPAPSSVRSRATRWTRP